MTTERTIPLFVTERELHGLLAALRLYQRFDQYAVDRDHLPEDSDAPVHVPYHAWFLRMVYDIASNGSTLEPLSYGEAGELGGRINTKTTRHE